MSGEAFLAEVTRLYPDNIRLVLSGYSDINSVLTLINEAEVEAYIHKPWTEEDLKLHIRQAYDKLQLKRQINHQNHQLKTLNSSLEAQVQDQSGQLKFTLEHLHQANSQLKKQKVESLRMLSQITEVHPGIHQGQSQFVADKSALIAKELLLDEAHVQDILIAGLLIQIGKLILPEQILNKPLYHQKTWEREEFYHHPLEAEKLLNGMDQFQAIALLIRHQYARYDGHGHPKGIAGDNIPMGSRIIRIVQDFYTFHHGLMTGKKSETLNETLDYLMAKKGKAYDPEILELFVTLVSGKPYQARKIIEEIQWFRLQVGMKINLVKYRDRIFSKNQIATRKLIEDIRLLYENLGPSLVIKIELR